MKMTFYFSVSQKLPNYRERNKRLNLPDFKRSFSSMKRLLTLALFSLFLGLFSTLQACPGCKDPNTMTATADIKTIQNSFSWSVLFLLAVPMGLIASFTVMVVNIEKKRPQPPASPENR
jgi:hypothetical protein